VTAATTSDAAPLDGAATDTFPTPVLPEQQRSESPFASQGGTTPSGRAVPPLPVSSDTGSGGAEIPGDLDLRPGLELIHRRVLGQGGMGVVHLVLDPRLGRRAALKVLRAPVTPSRVRRFRREIAVTSRLDHPGIPPVYEAGLTPAAQHYLLMRYVQGESLAELFARRSQLEGSKKKEWHKDTRELLHALVKVGEAVSYAHSRGIVHRDLKPANIMIGSFGEVFVMDWGLARDLHESSDEDQWIRSELGIGDAPVGITQDGAILGTPGYLAPEQARGEDVDAKADVFSLGAVLAELLTGKPPVIGPNVLAILGLTRGGEVEFPHQRFVTVDPELDAIATRALAPVASNRYESAEAFTSDLRAYLEGRNVAAYRYRPVERARRFVRRHPVLATAFALSAVLYLTIHVLIGRNEKALADATAAQAELRATQVAAFVGQGEAALDRHDGAAARERFLQALALDSSDVRATFGKTMAERLLDEERRAAKKEQEGRDAAARRAHAEEAAAGLVKKGDEQLAAGALPDARRAYEQALGFVEKHAAAREGVIRVEERLRQEAELERVRREGERDAGKSAQFLDEARAALARQDARAAKEALLKALAFGGGDEAKVLLAQVEETLVDLRMREVQAELERREASQAERLVARGNEALAQGKPEEASTSFVQALAFDGKSEAARRGLVQASEAVRRREQSTRDEAARRERSRRVADQVAAARAAVVRGREARARAAGLVKVREEYFAALSALDQALALEPRDMACRQEKSSVARELAQLLFEDGHQELGEFVLRLAGAAREGDVPLDPASDPHVVIVEADKVRIGQAFDGAVRFQPTRAFDKLREYVRGFGDRYRVTVQVRSETTSSTPPQVLAVGLWIRVEDRQSNTVHPTIKVAFEGGPYPRGVTVDPTGRLVSAFDRAYDLDEERYVSQVEAAVRAILEPAPPGN
jgi:tetratricopeptide (TPR) repeat protein